MNNSTNLCTNLIAECINKKLDVHAIDDLMEINGFDDLRSLFPAYTDMIHSYVNVDKRASIIYKEDKKKFGYKIFTDDDIKDSIRNILSVHLNDPKEMKFRLFDTIGLYIYLEENNIDIDEISASENDESIISPKLVKIMKDALREKNLPAVKKSTITDTDKLVEDIVVKCRSGENLQSAIDYIIDQGFIFVESTTDNLDISLGNYPKGFLDGYRKSIFAGCGNLFGYHIVVLSDDDNIVIDSMYNQLEHYSFLDHPIEWLSRYDPKNSSLENLTRFYDVLISCIGTDTELNAKFINLLFKSTNGKEATKDDTEFYLKFKDSKYVYIACKKNDDKTMINVHGIRCNVDEIVFESGIRYDIFDSMYKMLKDAKSEGELPSGIVEKTLNAISECISYKGFQNLMTKVLFCEQNEDVAIDIHSFYLGRYEVLYDECSKHHVTVITGIDSFILSI